MASWDDVDRIASALPDAIADTDGDASWKVHDKTFAWERPLRKSDLAALGPDAPTGAILAAHVPDLGAKDALIADDPNVYFTTPHFNGYRAILVQLDHIGVDDLDELLVEAWLARAPKRLVQQYLSTRPDPA